MPMEFQMLSESLEEPEKIEQALQQLWEPFAVYKGEVYFRRMFHNESRESRSSTLPSNQVIWTPEVE